MAAKTSSSSSPLSQTAVPGGDHKEGSVEPAKQPYVLTHAVLHSTRLGRPMRGSTVHLSQYHILPRSAHAVISQASLSVLHALDGGRYRQTHFGKICLQHIQYSQRLFHYTMRFPWPLRTPHCYPSSGYQRSRYALEDLIYMHYSRETWRLHGSYHSTAHFQTPTMKLVGRQLWQQHKMDISVLCLYRPRTAQLGTSLRGAAVESRGNYGQTPLVMASRHGQPDIVRLLIETGAAVDSHNNDDWTPLAIASQNGHPNTHPRQGMC